MDNENTSPRIGRPVTVYTMDMRKACRSCKETKLCSEFYWQKSNGVDGTIFRHPMFMCKECTKKARKDDILKRGAEINKIRKVRYRKDPNKFRQRTLEWQRQFPEKMALIKLVRYERMKGAITAESSLVTRDWFNQLIKSQNKLCFYCGKNLPLESEHIIPICRGGKHVRENIVASCRACNASKGTLLLNEWKPHL